jgi:uncharacterized protein (TIGR03083 family)
MTNSDTSTLRPLVDAWSSSAETVLDLVTALDEEQLATPSDLPGWTVRDILAHLAHLESELAGEPPVLADESEIPPDAADDPFRAYTERGVAARRARETDALVAELRAAVDRLREVLADPTPADPPGSFPRPGTTWEPLLRDRTFDYWMHEQDIRRAIGQPGGWDSPGAMLSLAVLKAALPYVVGKKVAPPVGTAVAITVDGPGWSDTAVVAVADDGRARPSDRTVEEADVRLVMSAEAFVLAGGGRRDPSTLDITVEGDAELGQRLVAALAVTP